MSSVLMRTNRKLALLAIGLGVALGSGADPPQAAEPPRPLALQRSVEIDPVLGDAALLSRLPAMPPVECGGNQQMRIVDRQIAVAADAVRALGNCRLRLVGAHVMSSGIAVYASGNAVVTIEGSFVQGERQAIRVAGNAEVRFRDSTLRGAIATTSRRPGGGVIDRGGTAVEPVPDPVVAPLAPMATVVCEDGESVELAHRRITGSGDGIQVSAGCQLVLSDSHIRVDGWGIRVSRGGAAVVRNSVIEAGFGGIQLTGGASLNIAGSSVPDGLHIVGDATAIDGGGNAWLR